MLSYSQIFCGAFSTSKTFSCFHHSATVTLKELTSINPYSIIHRLHSSCIGHIEDHRLHLVVPSLQLLSIWSFPQVSLAFMTLPVLKVIRQFFCRMLVWVSLISFCLDSCDTSLLGILQKTPGVHLTAPWSIIHSFDLFYY